MTEQNNFLGLGLSEDIAQNLADLGFEKPTEIQLHAIPELLAGSRDILGLAQTGTGKTAGFSLPIIENIDMSKGTDVQALIVAPTRELAKQITAEIRRLRAKRKINTTTVYGGAPIGEQIRSIKRGSEIVVGTPGRILDLIRREVLDLSHLKYLVLDEADEMLSMGFIEDIEIIMEASPANKTILLFSATMPERLRKLANKYLKNKLEINLRKKDQTPRLTTEVYHEVFNRDKSKALRRVIDSELDFYGIVFANTRLDVDEAAKQLQSMGYAVEPLHGEIPQSRREITINKFRNKEINILVATDVAARGVDIKGLTHVVNIALPANPEIYIHRVGRTGRAGASGKAINLVSPKETRALQLIKGTAKGDITKHPLPSAEKVVEVQKSLVFRELKDLKTSQDSTSINPIVDDLLQSGSADHIIDALLSIAYGDKLNTASYPDIDTPKPSWINSRQRNRRGPAGKPGPKRNRTRNSGNKSSSGGSRRETNKKSGSKKRMH